MSGMLSIFFMVFSLFSLSADLVPYPNSLEDIIIERENGSDHRLRYVSFDREVADGCAEEILKEYPDLFYDGRGESGQEKMEGIDLWFSMRRSVSIGEARKITLDILHRLLYRLNHHEKIKPYLVEDPFPPERVEIQIHFRPEKDGDLDWLHTGKGSIFYYKKVTQKKLTTPIAFIGGVDGKSEDICIAPREYIDEGSVFFLEESFKDAEKTANGEH